MYAMLWRALPGPLWLRITLAVVLAVVVLFCLVLFLFPWLNTLFNAYEVTVQE